MVLSLAQVLYYSRDIPPFAQRENCYTTKLGTNLLTNPEVDEEIETAAENLKTLRSRINVDKMQATSFLMVLTGDELGYQREDGVYIVPIGCLRE
jgi:hypothetical protein